VCVSETSGHAAATDGEAGEVRLDEGGDDRPRPLHGAIQILPLVEGGDERRGDWDANGLPRAVAQD
jgi:hypothetical protein